MIKARLAANAPGRWTAGPHLNKAALSSLPRRGVPYRHSIALSLYPRCLRYILSPDRLNTRSSPCHTQTPSRTPKLTPPQLTFSSPLPNSFAPLLAQRIPHPPHLRDTLLARRWKQAEALEMGILDEVVDDTTPQNEGRLLQRAIEIGEREGVKIAPGSWGAMKVSEATGAGCGGWYREWDWEWEWMWVEEWPRTGGDYWESSANVETGSSKDSDRWAARGRRAGARAGDTSRVRVGYRECAAGRALPTTTAPRAI